MPWKIVTENGKHCVHKENEDGSIGELVTCHDTEEQAKRHMAALYANVEKANTEPAPMVYIKAAGDWTLDVLGVPFYGPNAGKDSQGQYFDERTNYHEDKWAEPPVVYYHGYTEEGKPAGSPQYIGKTIKRWVDQAGKWYRVLLDKGNEYAARIMEAAKDGKARASSGSAPHLVRVETDGHIAEWPVVELSLLDVGDNRQPANAYAVAMPVMKAIYDQAGISLPDESAESNAEQVASPKAEQAGATKANDAAIDSKIEGKIEMPENEEKKDVGLGEAQIKAIVDKALADQHARDEEARKAKEAHDAEVKAAVDAALKAQAAEYAKTHRLPYADGVPTQLHIDRRFDDLEPGAHAFVASVLMENGRPVSEDCLKALAAKMVAEEGRGDTASHAGLKALGLKSDEVMGASLSNYGSQWVGTAYSTRLWEKIRQGSFVVDQLQSNGWVVNIPDGYSSETIPLESTDPTWYKVAEANTITASHPDATITSSKATTANKSLSVAKMGCRVLYSGELNEDSLIRPAPQLMRQIEVSGREQMEHAIIDGDTTTSASTNINDIAGTPAGTEVFMLVDGFRKLPLITNTANSRDGGALTASDFLETVKLMGTAGQNALSLDRVAFILDSNTYWKALELPEVKTRDVNVLATVENGQLTRLWGYRVYPSAFMHYLSAARLANTSGLIDQDTTTNNTTGAILAVRWDQWAFGWKRRMTTEVTRYANADAWEIVALARWGLTYRDTEAAAISYDITVS